MTLSRETIKLMMQCQRMVNKEFGVRIELDNEQAIAMFLAYASQTSSVEFKACTEKLMVHIIPAESKATVDTVVQPKARVRYYRGQPVAVDSTKHSNAEPLASHHAKEITYRGQKIRA